DIRTSAFSADAKRLATGHQESAQIYLWDVDKGNLAFTLTNEAKLTLGLAFSHNDKLLASAVANDRSVRVWDLNSRRLKTTLAGQTPADWELALLPGDQTLASASSDRTIRLWDVENSQEISVLDHLNEIFEMAVAPDGHTLAAGIRGGKIFLSNATARPRQQ